MPISETSSALMEPNEENTGEGNALETEARSKEARPLARERDAVGKVLFAGGRFLYHRTPLRKAVAAVIRSMAWARPESELWAKASTGILIAENKLSKARRTLVRMARRRPEYAKHELRKVGNLLYDAQRYAEALEAFEEAIRIAPPTWEARQGRASTLVALGRHDEGIEALKTLFREDREEDPEGNRFTLVTAWTLLQCQRYQEALRFAEELEDDQGVRGQSHLIKGHCHQNLGHYREALDEFERCHALNPTMAKDSQVNVQRAFLRAQLGDRNGAWDCYREQFLPGAVPLTSCALFSRAWEQYREQFFPDVAPMDEMARFLAGQVQVPLRQSGLDGSVGLFNAPAGGAYGHTILDPFHAYNLYKHRFDHVVLVTPTVQERNPSFAVLQEIVKHSMGELKCDAPEVRCLSWLELGALTHERCTFLVHNYWGLNRAIYRARTDPTHPLAKRRIYFSLPPEMQENAAAICRRHAIGDEDRPVVVLHTREHGFHQLNAQSYRNTDVTQCIPAIRRLVNDGYQVVRVGDRKMTRIAEQVPGLIELPFCDGYDAVLDAYFISRCRFMIGCQSGPCSIARVFGKPNLVLNAVYHFSLIPESMDLVAFKRYYRRRRGTRVPLLAEEIFDDGLYLLDKTHQFNDVDVEMDEMTPDEILAAVDEMGRWVDSPEKSETAYQKRFREAARQGTRPGRTAPQAPALSDYVGYVLPECRVSDAVAALRRDCR